MNYARQIKKQYLIKINLSYVIEFLTNGFINNQYVFNNFYVMRMSLYLHYVN